MVIVDTSVVAKWFLEEEDSDRATLLMDKEPLGAPDLLRYELCNTFSCNPGLTRSEISDFLDSFFKLSIEFHTLPNDGFYRIADLSREFQISAYDATFVALAEALKTSFITADLKLAQRTRRLGFVKTLGEAV